ncbi:MAG: DUF2911 domain-containing protein, partial [Flavobacteriaceae bacterium]|nr:DUF2911 domain-containing protein [Flavobacteriaceae bacterium]
MKKIYFLVLAFFSSLLFTNSYAQSFRGLDEAPHDIVYLRESQAVMPLVKVLYGRPKKAEGMVFGEQVPYGKIWRTGADEATEIRFYKAVQFGDVKVPAGTYVLYTIPGADEWEVILNSKLDVLGAFQYDPVFDVAHIRVPVSKAEVLENFSIAFKDKGITDNMVLGWGSTRVSIPLVFEAPAALANQF